MPSLEEFGGAWAGGDVAGIDFGFDADGDGFAGRDVAVDGVVGGRHQRVALGVIGADAAGREVVGDDRQAADFAVFAVVDVGDQADLLAGGEPQPVDVALP